MGPRHEAEDDTCVDAAGGGLARAGPFPLPQAHFARGGRGSGRGAAICSECSMNWSRRLSSWLRASGRPSPSAGKNAGLCPLPRRGGGEGEPWPPAADPLAPESSHCSLPLPTAYWLLAIRHPPLPQLIHASRPRAILAPVPLHRGRASKAFWCGGGIGRSGNHCGHAPHILGGRRDPL